MSDEGEGHRATIAVTIEAEDEANFEGHIKKGELCSWLVSPGSSLLLTRRRSWWLRPAPGRRVGLGAWPRVRPARCGPRLRVAPHDCLSPFHTLPFLAGDRRALR